uniref:Protein E6 n=1 Tax=human papillomavirus 71 TaxID=120686 RepID=A0A6H0F2F8_9PAPI|nr:early protein E6 [human papillomavirus 71]
MLGSADLAMSSGDAYPTNLFRLCNQYDVDLQDLNLTCIFCRNQLTEVEVVAFAYKELKVVWRSGFPFAACACCLEIAGKLRQLRYWQFSGFANTVELDTGTPVTEQLIRCYVCHKPLCSVEKERIITEGRRFHKIAGHWRGACLQCWKPCEANNVP